MGKQNYENSINGINKVVDIWDCVTIANCRDIAIFSSNWTELFENSYTRPEEISIRGGKTAKISVDANLQRLRITVMQAIVFQKKSIYS